MRVRPWVMASAGLNVVFAIAWLATGKSVPQSKPAGTALTNAQGTNVPSVRTSVLVRRQAFTWEEVESDDYVTYIKNLRAIGCPEQTIRDLIVADVNQLYARRQMAEVISPDAQWWRSKPDPNLVEEAAQRIKALDAERRALLTKLLGAGWESENNPVPPLIRAGISLTGPMLGDLPTATKQAVYDVIQKMQHQLDAYLDAQRLAGKAVDPAELARIRKTARMDLVPILNPDQYEEFLLRYSETAQQLREELRGLELKPEEFRNLFRARDPVDSQAELYYSGNDPDAIRRQQELETQRENAMKQVLGAERFAAYKLNQDPLYRQSRETAEVLGVPADKVMPMYEINRLTQDEMDQIRNDPGLTNEEKVEALAAAQVEQQKSLEKILGPQAFERWLVQRAQ